jgi:DedD protein
MEDQKILWIVFSVVLFAVVVLASVLYFLKPKPGEPVLATSGTVQPAGFDTYEYVRGTSPTLPMEQGAKKEQGLQIVVGEEPSATPGSASVTAAEPGGGTKASAAAAGSAKPAPTRPAPAKPAPATQGAAPKPAASQPAQVYWIQAASFKSRSSAEATVAALGEKGVTSRIQVSDQSGQAYFRVRVGPYTSRGEAEKFLGWIKGVKGLEQSYIAVVSRGKEQAR